MQKGDELEAVIGARTNNTFASMTKAEEVA
jgi:hypothetical protein